MPFLSPGDLPDPGIEPESPALAGGFITTEPPGKPQIKYLQLAKFPNHFLYISVRTLIIGSPVSEIYLACQLCPRILHEPTLKGLRFLTQRDFSQPVSISQEVIGNRVTVYDRDPCQEIEDVITAIGHLGHLQN